MLDITAPLTYNKSKTAFKSELAMIIYIYIVIHVVQSIANAPTTNNFSGGKTASYLGRSMVSQS